MDGDLFLENYFDQYTSQDDLASNSLPTYAPLSPFANDPPLSSLPDVPFSDRPEPTKDFSASFSSVDLSFLPDDLPDDNKHDDRDVPKEDVESQLSTQDLGTVLEEGSQTQQREENADHALPDVSGVCPPLTPMTPMTPTSESSGIVPQLQ
uniref:Uncharacterized protein n=2 Tax=Sphaerodactylus townsendi TaxID=933632 RepID=A0ACB8G691_9SAUR